MSFRLSQSPYPGYLLSPFSKGLCGNHDWTDPALVRANCLGSLSQLSDSCNTAVSATLPPVSKEGNSKNSMMNEPSNLCLFRKPLYRTQPVKLPDIIILFCFRNDFVPIVTLLSPLCISPPFVSFLCPCPFNFSQVQSAVPVLTILGLVP